MTELTIYDVEVPDDVCPNKNLTFYARQKGQTYEAICLGFAAHDKPLNEESDLEYHERSAREAASRSMRVKNTIIKGDDGELFDQKWRNQAVLVALWRKLEKLEFLKLPKNPFLCDRPPEHTVDVADFDERFTLFRRWEQDLPKTLKSIKERCGGNDGQEVKG